MHILCLTDLFCPDYTGGVCKSLLPEIEGLANLGYHITLVSRRYQKNTPRHEVKSEYEFYRYFSPLKNSKFYRVYPLFTLINLPNLITNLHKQFPFDIAYVHNPFQKAALDKVLPDLPCVYVYHASAYSEINLDVVRGKYGQLKPVARIVNHWVKSLENKILATTHQVIVRSQFMKNDMKQLYGNIDEQKVISLPLCVDTEKFNFVENNFIVRQKLVLPQDRPILLTVRRLVARMGIENLITAIKSVVQNFPNILLLIGGTGYLEEDFRQMIQQYNLENNVKLIGFVPEELLPMYYQAADLFTLPTLAYEGFGLVTIESLACGTPVIATPIGASPEVLSPLGKEFLFEDSTPDAIARGISYWLKQGFSLSVRKRCRNYCVDKFSKKQVSNQLEQTFIQCIQAVVNL